jgi:hypothetical protein
LRILLQLLLLVDSLDRKKERTQSFTVGISFSVATNLSFIANPVQILKSLFPLKNRDLLTRQYTFSSSRPASFQRGHKSSANQFWAYENLCGCACCLNCKARRICLISLLGFNVIEFFFLHEFSTVLELVISGVFENLRILLQVLLALELETKVLE